MAQSEKEIVPDRKAPDQVRADLTKEYVAGGSVFNGNSPRTLPLASDDAQRELGAEVYECMLRDPDVSAAVWLLINGTLSDGVMLTPAVGDKDAQSQKALDIAEFCNRSLTNLQKPFRQILEALLEGALAFGNKVAEQNYELSLSGVDSGKLVLRSIKPKPGKSVMFVVDEFKNVLGIASDALAARVRQSGSLTQASPARLEYGYFGRVIIPREKFVVLALRSKDEDPRGSSSLRPAVNAWNLKQMTWPEYLRFLVQYALANIVATLASDADDEDAYNDQGVLLTDESGEPQKISAAQALFNQLIKFRNGQFLIVREGTKIDPLKVPGEGESFREAIKLFGNEITRAILLQTQATREGEHGNRAESQQKMSVLDMLIWWLKGIVAETIRTDILKPLVRYNFGDEAAEDLTPVASLGDTERRDWSVDAKAASDIAPYLTDSQWDAITKQLGIPAPAEGEERPKRVKAQASAKGADAESDDEDEKQNPAKQESARPERGKSKRAAAGADLGMRPFVSVRLPYAA